MASLLKAEYYLEENLRHQVFPFYDALLDNSGNGYDAQCNSALDNVSSSLETAKSTLERHGPSHTMQSIRSSRLRMTMLAIDSNSLALKNITKGGKSPVVSSTPQQNGYRIFHPGTYEYPFEILLDHACPETIKLPNSSVRWILQAVVQRSGAFKSDIHTTKEVLVVRAPDPDSLEYVQQIPVRKLWDDHLHCDAFISGKSFPIGSKIPIVFKLTPLTKIRYHGIKVYLSEHSNYLIDSEKGVTASRERELLLFEQIAGKPLAREYAASEFRMLSVGEMPREVREETQDKFQGQRKEEARRLGRPVAHPSRPADDLLGDLVLGFEHLTCQTEIEMEVQLPTCAQMSKNKTKSIHPDTSWRFIQVNHWIKVRLEIQMMCLRVLKPIAQIVMHLSEADEEVRATTGPCRVDFSINTPLNLLSCLATPTYTLLPEYSDQNMPGPGGTYQCGCPDASTVADISRSSSIDGIFTARSTSYSQSHQAALSLATPPQANLSTHGASRVQTPIHILRNPRFDPPGFDAPEASPLLKSPPPAYDMIIGTPSHDGLVDYFTRYEECFYHNLSMSNEK